MEDQPRLVALRESFARDCEQLHAVAAQKGIWNPLRLHILAYDDLARRPGAMPSQYLTRAIDRVAQQLRAAKAKPPRRDPFPSQSLDLDARCAAYDPAGGILRIQSMESRGVAPWNGRAFRLALAVEFPDDPTRQAFARGRFLGGTLIVLEDGRPSILVARMAPELPAAAPAPEIHNTTIVQKVSLKIRGDVGSVRIESGTRPRRPRKPAAPKEPPIRQASARPRPAPPVVDPTPRAQAPGSPRGDRRHLPTAPGGSPTSSSLPALPVAPSRVRWIPTRGAHLCLVTPGQLVDVERSAEVLHLVAVTAGRRRRPRPAVELTALPTSPGLAPAVGLLPNLPGPPPSGFGLR
jgi:hypothetical protein